MQTNVRWARWAVSAAWVIAAAAGIAGIVVGSVDWADPARAIAVIGLIPLGLSLVVAHHAPRHPAAALIASAGTVLILSALPMLAAAPFEGTWIALYLPFAILLLVLPDGHAPSALWRWVGWSIVAVAVAFAIVAAVPPAGGTATYVLLLAFFGLLLVCAAAPIVRYRRSGERERLQLRWIYLAGLSLPVTLLLCWAGYLTFGTPDLVGVGLAAMFVLIPVGATIAIVRPTLIDIDQAAVTTVTISILAVLVLMVLSVAGALAGVMLDWPPTAAIGSVATLTALAALTFRRLRDGFGRLLYPQRARALSALSSLSKRVDAGLADPEEIQPVLRIALRDPGLLVAYRALDGSGAFSSVDGNNPQMPLTENCAPLHLHGMRVGMIVASAERARAPSAAAGRTAARLVDVARTRAALREATAEVEASRARILRAGYEQRRRLERDLHDGAQQRLVALGMQLRVLQRAAPADDATAAALDAAVAELGTAVAELRRIAHGMRPSALDDGLGPALASLAKLAPTTIDLDVDAPEIPDVVATTAYYVVSEAVTNALRHAEASRIRVSVREASGMLLIRIDDDGRGGAAASPTGGLTGMTDRVDALGGTVTVTSQHARGTTVRARIPCGSS